MVINIIKWRNPSSGNNKDGTFNGAMSDNPGWYLNMIMFTFP